MIKTQQAGRISPAFLRNQDNTTFTDNERLLLDLVRHRGAMSRADLARQTDLTMQSVVRLIDGLVARGFLGFGDKVSRLGPGQPSKPVSLIADAAFTYGVSIMTDAVSVCLMDLAGEVRATTSAVVDVADRSAVLRSIKSSLPKLTARGRADVERIFGMGVATTGYFVGPGELNTPAAMNDWALRNLEDEFAQLFALPVWVENDGNAAAAGESLYGAGRRYRNFAYIYIASGLGGGIVIDGEVQRGFRGNAGEFTGLLPLSQRSDRPTLNLLIDILKREGIAVTGIGDLLHRFDLSWPGVREWIERSREPLTAILSAISAVVDPEAIIIGGRVPPSLARALAQEAQFFHAPLRDRDRPVPIVLPAEASGDAAAQGAAAIPFKRHFFR